jgi:nucleotide-binding universal stress UspA family protein
MYKTILVPIDLSEESSWRKAVPTALELARAFGARINLATVVRDIDAIWKTQYFPIGYEMMVKEAENKLAHLARSQMPAATEPNIFVGQGSIYSEVLRIAAETSTDLIVLASHRPEMKDYLIGPNAALIARHANCSVMIVRE